MEPRVVNEPKEENPSLALRALLDDYRSAHLSTVDREGNPLSSYAPWALDSQNRFLLFVSDLSEHSQNLQQAPRASLMLIEDEAGARNLYARKRAVFSGPVEQLPRDSSEYEDAAGRHRERFGKFFDLLAGFSDFRMFRLEPSTVRLVIGFGAAFTVTGPNWDRFERIGPSEES